MFTGNLSLIIPTYHSRYQNFRFYTELVIL